MQRKYPIHKCTNKLASHLSFKSLASCLLDFCEEKGKWSHNDYKWFLNTLNHLLSIIPIKLPFMLT